MLDNYDEILTLAEVSNILKIGATNTYKLVKSGELKAFKTGRSWKISKQDLIDYIKERGNNANRK